jgi:DNA-binding transcriptional MocR family regulator
VDALQRAFGDRLKFRVPQGGMALWAAVDAGVSVERWLQQAQARGVLFQPGKQFHFTERAVGYVRMGYAALSEAEIGEAVRRLERAWRAAER